jgi:hypothetical protein
MVNDYGSRLAGLGVATTIDMTSSSSSSGGWKNPAEGSLNYAYQKYSQESDITGGHGPKWGHARLLLVVWYFPPGGKTKELVVME